MPSHYGYADMEEYLYYVLCEEFDHRFEEDKADGIEFYENTIKPYDALREHIETFICDQIPDNMMRSVVLSSTDYDFIWKELMTNCTATIEDAAD